MRTSLSSEELHTSKSEETEETKQENSEVKISKKKLFETCSHAVLNAELLASPKGAVPGSTMNVPPSMRRRLDPFSLC